MSKKRLVVAIDPGSGVSSPTGFTVFDPDSKEIIYTANINTKHKKLEHRLRDISDKVKYLLDSLVNVDRAVSVYIESFVMRGKGGETLQRLIGAFMSKTPYEFSITHVQNSTVKKVLAGHGQGDKVAVARGTQDFFKGNKDSVELINNLISKGELDILDSLAIGVAGWLSERKK